MTELFRYIEQAFVVPPLRREAIDVSTNTDFQDGLRAAIEGGADRKAVRTRAEAFLDGVLSQQDGPLSRLQPYLDLRKALLRRDDDISHADVNDAIHDAFDEDPDALVGSDRFRRDKTTLSDIVVALKLTTGFNKTDAAAVATARRMITFIEEFVAGDIEPLNRDEIRARLNRPLRIPKDLLRSAAPQRVEQPAPRPDPSRARRDALLVQQAALHSAYKSLMRVHPSQLEVKTLSRAVTPPPEPPAHGCPDPVTVAAGILCVLVLVVLSLGTRRGPYIRA